MEQQDNLDQLFKPQDLSRTVENAMNLFQGRHEALPELLKDAGTFLTRASKKFTPKQLILAVGGLAVAAILVVTYLENKDDHSGENDHDHNLERN